MPNGNSTAASTKNVGRIREPPWLRISSTSRPELPVIDRRVFLQDLSGTAAALALPSYVWKQQSDLTPIFREVERRHDETVQRLQEWIKQPSIAAENRGMTEGCDLTIRLFRDAGFQQVTKIASDGQPGIFA